MSIRDYQKTTYKTEFECYNIKQLNNIVMKINDDYERLNSGTFYAKLIVEYNDRDSDL